MSSAVRQESYYPKTYDCPEPATPHHHQVNLSPVQQPKREVVDDSTYGQLPQDQPQSPRSFWQDHFSSIIRSPSPIPHHLQPGPSPNRQQAQNTGHRVADGRVTKQTRRIKTNKKNRATGKKMIPRIKLKCAHCMRKGHALLDCQIPAADGCLPGCPKCHTLEHDYDTCVVKVPSRDDRYYLLVLRDGKCPLKSRIDLSAIATFNSEPYRPHTLVFSQKLFRHGYYHEAKYGEHIFGDDRVKDPAWNDPSMNNGQELAQPLLTPPVGSNAWRTYVAGTQHPQTPNQPHHARDALIEARSFGQPPQRTSSIENEDSEIASMENTIRIQHPGISDDDILDLMAERFKQKQRERLSQGRLVRSSMDNTANARQTMEYPRGQRRPGPDNIAQDHQEGNQNRREKDAQHADHVPNENRDFNPPFQTSIPSAQPPRRHTENRTPENINREPYDGSRRSGMIGESADPYFSVREPVKWEERARDDYESARQPSAYGNHFDGGAHFKQDRFDRDYR